MKRELNKKDSIRFEGYKNVIVGSNDKTHSHKTQTI